MKTPAVRIYTVAFLMLFSTLYYAQDDFGFRFVRVIYDDNGRHRWWGRAGMGAWATDWPESDYNLHDAIDRTTNIRVVGEPRTLSFKDSAIFEYPVVYLTEPGYWLLTDEEQVNMTEYFARGGFLIIDDFHDYGGFGSQWYNMYDNLKRIFPDKEPVPLAPDHIIWSIYYDVDPVEAPSTKSYESFGRYDDQYFGVYDDDGRVMCLISYNQDLGDGWEHPFGRRVLEEASTASFQMAINFIIYALTH